MSETKTFPIGTVLSLTKDILLGEFDSLHEAIEYVAGYPVWTHQLPRVAEAIKPHVMEDLRTYYPALVEVEVPLNEWRAMPGWEDGSADKAKVIDDWVEEFRIEHILPSEIALTPMPQGPAPRDPIEEIIEMRKGDVLPPIVVVQAPSAGEEG